MSDNVKLMKSPLTDDAIYLDDCHSLALVTLVFDENTQCEVYLEPAIVTRLQNGDNELLNQLKQQMLPSSVSENGSEILPSAYNFTIESSTSDEITKEISLEADKIYNEDVQVQDSISPETTKRKFEMNGAETEETNCKMRKIVAHDHTETSMSSAVTKCEKQKILEKLKENNHMDFTADKMFPLKKSKQRPRRYLKYSLEDRDTATKLVLEGSLSIYEAQKKFGIPLSTMCDMVKKVGGERFKCKHCEKGFPMEHMLAKHETQHFRNKLCPHCGHASVNDSGLKRHLFTVHPTEAEVAYGKEYINYMLTRFKCGKWSQQNTKKLFSLYGKYLQDQDQGTTSEQNINVWKNLADSFWQEQFYVTPNQVQRKWRTLLRSYRLFKERGQKQKQPRFFKDVENFLFLNEGKNIDFGEVDDVLDEFRVSDAKAEDVGKSKQGVWNSKLIISLLEEVDKRICLFKDANVDDLDIWCDIATLWCKDGLVFSNKQLQAKWNHLLNMYNRKHWKKITENETNEKEDKDDPKWLIDMQKDEDYIQYGWKLCPIVGKIEKRKESDTKLDGLLKRKMLLPPVDTDYHDSLLITEYGKRLDQFDDESIDNSSLWNEIGAVYMCEGHAISGLELEMHWLHLVERYKEALRQERLENNSEYANTFQYLDDMKSVLGIFSDEELFSKDTEAVNAEKDGTCDSPEEIYLESRNNIDKFVVQNNTPQISICDTKLDLNECYDANTVQQTLVSNLSADVISKHCAKKHNPLEVINCSPSYMIGQEDENNAIISNMFIDVKGRKEEKPAKESTSELDIKNIPLENLSSHNESSEKSFLATEKINKDSFIKIDQRNDETLDDLQEEDECSHDSEPNSCSDCKLSIRTAVQNVINGLQHVNTYRNEIESKHVKILNQMKKKQLSQVKSMDDMIKFFERFQSKHNWLEKQKNKEIEKIHNRQIIALKKLV